MHELLHADCSIRKSADQCLLTTPRSLSQASTSFIACNRQGIHHVHLVACLYNFDFSFENTVIKLSFCVAVSKAIFEITSFTSDCNHYPPIIFGFFFQIIGFFLLLSRLLKNFCYLRSLKDQIKSFSFKNALIWLLLVEVDGIEPTTPCLQSRCSPS